MSNLEAVLFDYGLVLSGPPDPAAWELFQQTLEMNEASFHTAYWQFRHEYDRGALTAKTYWDNVSGRELAPDQFQAVCRYDTDLWTRPNQPMIDWAAQLQQSGIKTGILSNIGDAMETGVRARCNWLSGFTHHTFSHRLRIAKPELAIYRHAAEGLGVLPETILFIDDRAENVAAAREIGMQAVQYTEHRNFVAGMQKSGFAYLFSLD